MKKLCVLATAENVDLIRATAYENIPELIGHKILNYPLSETGELPATHWFCPMNGDKRILEKAKSLQKLSEMEMAEPSEFLARRNLKMIKK